MMLLVNFHVASETTVTPPTININGTGAKYLFPIGQNSGKPFSAGLHIIFYDGTHWRMMDNAFLPIIGGSVHGSIVPMSMGYNLGSSSNPWGYVYAKNARVDGNDVWHKGNTGAQRVALQLSVSSESNLSFYIKDPVTNIVYVNISASGISIVNELKIAALPTGFRPGQIVYSGTASAGDTAMYGYISTNGEVKAKNAVVSTNAHAWTFLQFTFVAEN